MARILSANEFVMSSFARVSDDSSRSGSGPGPCSWFQRGLLAGIVSATFLSCSAQSSQDPQTPGLKERPQIEQPVDPATTGSSVGAPDLQGNEKPVANLSARQKLIAADKATLLKLATELKKEIDKSGTGTLSVSAIRKANEIEKLAHTVRQEMNDDRAHAP
jgi:hypothetical protein